MPKKRVEIPDDIAAEILFLSDRTCCICSTRGKAVQIHHIDENPSNNSIDNLAVLCLECHNETMINGGFGRKLNANQIIKYRKEWIERVKKRKKKADEIASIETVTGSTKTIIATDKLVDNIVAYKTNDDPDLLKDYIRNILTIHQKQLVVAQEKWDTGITVKVNGGSYDMIDFYEEVLIELSSFYPKGHFGNQLPNEYFNEIISSKFEWYRLALEPDGAGTGGTIVSTMTGGHVMEDLKQMIIDMVNTLTSSYNIDKEIDFSQWRSDWLQ